MFVRFDTNTMDDQLAGMIVTKETYRICSEHEGCVNCPLVGGNVVNIQGANVACETGKTKQS